MAALSDTPENRDTRTLYVCVLAHAGQYSEGDTHTREPAKQHAGMAAN